MKKISRLMVFALVVAFAAFAFVGCSTPAQTATATPAASATAAEETAAEQTAATDAASEAPAGEKLLIGRIELNLAMPYQQADASAFQAYADKLGVEVVILDGKSSPTTISSSMEDLIARKVDGIIVQANDGPAISPFVKEAQDAGIPVLTFVNASDTPGPNAYLDENGMSQQLGAEAAKRWQQFHPDEPIVVGLLGIPCAPVVERDRTQAFATGVLSVDPNATILESVETHGVRDEAVAAAEDLLQAHPEVNIVFGLNGDAALGGISAFEAAGRGKAVDGVPQTELFVSVDGSEQEMVKLADPTSSLKLCMALTPKDFAEKLMDITIDCINGKIDWKTAQNINLNDVIFDYWSSSVDDMQNFLTQQYNSKIDLKEQLNLK